jgi:uncharacterized protein (UPF0332 family)
MSLAHEKLAAGRALLSSEFPGQAVGLAYYGMLYAARAALSETDRSAKTHSGAWNLFQQAFVDTGRFDRELLREARASQRAREATDYDAGHFSAEEATQLVTLGERFVAAVEATLAERPPTSPE